MLNRTSLDGWMQKGRAPALDHSLIFYNLVKGGGLQIFLISSRGEHLRDATIENLINAGYHGWTSLILRFVFTKIPVISCCGHFRNSIPQLNPDLDQRPRTLI